MSDRVMDQGHMKLSDRQIMDPPPGGWKKVPVLGRDFVVWRWVPASEYDEHIEDFRESVQKRHEAARQGTTAGIVIGIILSILMGVFVFSHQGWF